MGQATVMSFGSRPSAKGAAFGSRGASSGTPGSRQNFLRAVQEQGCGFLVVVAPKEEQLRILEELDGALGKTVVILLNARLRVPLRKGGDAALRERLASVYDAAFHLRLVGRRGAGLVFRALRGEDATPWVLARRQLPSTVPEEVARSDTEPSAARIASAFA
mmetsp:Transcript_50534/g.103973  ORF Transcript_50534/g.103973 Transcript_50534/m.103973 type:complete len:162 (+) Transcript_50534:3-488(+)